MKIRASIIIFILCVAFQFCTAVVTEPTKAETNDTNNIKIVGEILAGGLGGLAGVVVPLAVIDFPSSKAEVLGYDFLTVFCTYPIGSAIGVYLVGSIGNETGSFAATLGGSLLGEVAGIMILEWYSEYVRSWYTLVPIFLAAPIGATIGFNRTRKYTSPSATKAAPIRFDLVKVRF